MPDGKDTLAIKVYSANIAVIIATKPTRRKPHVRDPKNRLRRRA
jgi:hypothetical protein